MRAFKFTRYFLLAALMAGLTGCISGRVVKNYNKSVEKGDGILLVAVDTQVPVNYLLLKRTDRALSATEIMKFKPGRSVRFIELPAGTYDWDQVHLSTVSAYENLIDYYITINKDKEKYFTFTVKPGVTNYPGDFVINENDKGWNLLVAKRFVKMLHDYGSQYYLQLIDRDAMLEQTLTPSQRRMIKRLGMAYVGPGKDAFPEFYRSLLAQQGGAK